MSVLNSYSSGAAGTGHERALRIFASSIARELKERGYAPRHIVTVAGELISLACDFIRSKPAVAAAIADGDK